MASIKYFGQFIGVTLPTIFLLVWSLDALLLVAEDVFFIVLIQLVLFGVFFWRYHEPSD